MSHKGDTGLIGRGPDPLYPPFGSATGNYLADPSESHPVGQMQIH